MIVSGDEEFEEAVLDLVGPPDGNLLVALPRCAILTNGSDDRTVTGCGVILQHAPKMDRAHADGSVHPGKRGHLTNFGEDPIKPGGSRLVCRVAILSEPPPPAAQEAIGRWVNSPGFDANEPAPSITIDWVQLDGVEVFGPDTMDAFAVLTARAESPAKLEAELDGMSQSEIAAFLAGARADPSNHNMVRRWTNAKAAYRVMLARILHANNQGDVKQELARLKAAQKMPRRGGTL